MKKKRPFWLRLITFLFLWGCVGYSLGTTTLLGPVRWTTEKLRAAESEGSLENLAVMAIIIAFVLVSLAVAVVLSRVTLASRRLDVRAGIPLLALIAASGAMWLWMTPAELGGDQGEERVAGARFTFGPYPDSSRLDRLVGEGYTGVISLLHPAVVPFEPKLLADERAATERAGIDLIHLPMLPWVGDNSDVLERLEQIAASNDGRYYVHCYLGRDRVRLARAVVERAVADVEVSSEEIAPVMALSNGTMFERGKVIALEEDVFLSPYPTDEEFSAWVVAGRWGAVVSLLDPKSSEDSVWIEKEREILTRFGIEFVSIPLDVNVIEPGRIVDAVDRAQKLPRPLLVHAFLGPDSGKSPIAEAFVQAWRSGLPPLPPSRLVEGLARGPITAVAPNVAVGPRPRGPEFWTLRRHGVRKVLYLGAESSPAAQEDRAAAKEAPLRWLAADPASDQWTKLLDGSGPWYVYRHENVLTDRDRLARELGPAVPDETRGHLVTLRRATAPAVEDDRPSKPAAEVKPRFGDAAGHVAAQLGTETSMTEHSGAFALVLGFVPAPRTLILLGPLLLFCVGIAAWYAGWLRSERGVRTPYTRKIFHFSIFSVAAALHVAGGLPLVVLFSSLVSGAVLYAVWRGDGFPFYEALARPTDAPRRSLFILIPLVTTATGGVLSNVFFGAFAPVGYLVGGWGDAVGEPVGTRWGRRRYRVPSILGVAATRSLEGSTAVIVIGSLAAFLALVLAGFSVVEAAGVAVACGICGGLVEAVSHHGLDNLTIQLAAAGAAFWLLG